MRAGDSKLTEEQLELWEVMRVGTHSGSTPSFAADSFKYACWLEGLPEPTDAQIAHEFRRRGDERAARFVERHAGREAPPVGEAMRIHREAGLFRRRTRRAGPGPSQD